MPGPRSSSTRSAWAGREARGKPARPGASGGGGGWGGGEDYWKLSARPLASLVLLLPLIVFYELGSLWYLTDNSTGAQQTIRAEKLMHGFFDLFGVLGVMAPGLAIVAVLLAWHVLARHPWRIRPLVITGMALEAALWSLPLLVFGALMQRLGQMSTGLEAAAALGGVGELGWQARLTISIGAGLYEELLFRMLAIAALHLIVKDLLQAGEGLARVAAVVGSAVAFALYHDQVYAGAAADPSAASFLGLLIQPFIFYTAAGVFFAILYLLRGFGVVAAAHAVYDILVLVILAR